jgi:hypothetical protein
MPNTPLCGEMGIENNCKISLGWHNWRDFSLRRGQAHAWKSLVLGLGQRPWLVVLFTYPICLSPPGDNFTPRGQNSPLGVKFAPRREVKNGPQARPSPTSHHSHLDRIDAVVAAQGDVVELGRAAKVPKAGAQVRLEVVPPESRGCCSVSRTEFGGG